MVCSLEVHNLNSDPAPEYYTLSYVWGSATVTDLVPLEGQEWPVTVNLANALRFLRDTKKRILIWIDALCINQANTKERGLQVQLMRDIYSCATKS